MFLDEAKLFVKAGDGGNGAVAFRREKYVPFGGPAGGDGGKGGDVVLVTTFRRNTLSHFHHKSHFRANSGKGGSNFNRTGSSAPDLRIEVPIGTVVRDAETQALLADLHQRDQEFVIAHGGRGGRGNARFKTSTNQSPRVGEKGEPGQERWIDLELRLLADVGIIGMPNAGKSTLLSVITAARPRIGAYPFTTLVPNLGTATISDNEIVFADIPGLVEGAHAGVGLGHSFLRHVLRTRLLVHLVDGAGSDPVGDFVQINSELALYDQSLAREPQLVVVSKLDLPDAHDKFESIHAALAPRSIDVIGISAVSGQGLELLLNHVVSRLEGLPKVSPVAELPVFKLGVPEAEFEVKREGASYRVTGAGVERAAAMTYWEYEEAVERFHRILDAMGIADKLRQAGIRKGDSVMIGERELEWAE